MASYERKQGDSLWVDIKCDAVADIDKVWTNWEASWNIIDENGIVVMSGNSFNRQSIFRDEEGDTFFLRIGPLTTIGWADLSIGDYGLTIQIDNSVVDYRHEEQHRLKVTKQSLQA